MKVDPRMIEPFNAWWRTGHHCEAGPKAIEAFAAGFKAGMEQAVAEAKSLLSGASSSEDVQQNE